MRVRAFAPPSVGNFAVGFDVLGAAIAPETGELWGDVVEAEEAEGWTLGVTGAHAGELPGDPGENLVTRVWERFSEALALQGRRAGGCRVTLDKGLPVGSGLGSSSCSIAAALTAFNALHGEPFTAAELLWMGGHVEGAVCGSVHYDNVAPCLLGGLRLVHRGEPVRADALPVPGRWRVVVVHPDLQVKTSEARAILPREVPLRAAVGYWQNAASFVHALHVGDDELVRRVLVDELVEPHRAALVPGLAHVRQAALGLGALGCSLSGSGPTVFAVVSDGRGEEVLRAMVEGFALQGHRSEGRVCRIDEAGARLMPV